jgi:iron-sulfur cluster assembly accessory protein
MNLTVTDGAREQLTTLLAGRDEGPTAIRLFAQQGGGCACSGPGFGMGLDEIGEQDQVVEVGTLKIIADPASALALEGASIDYVNDVMQQGFAIDAPNASLLGGGGGGGGCGCS